VARALTALTIGPLLPAGNDGVLADLRTFAALGLHGCAVVTTFAGTPVDPAGVAAQLDGVLDRVRVDIVKVTCPADADVLAAIALALQSHGNPRYVVDPAEACFAGPADEVLKAQLLPNAFAVLPNIVEAQALSGRVIDSWDDMRAAARAIAALGPANVVLKGGQREGNQVTDLLFDGADYRDYTAARVDEPAILGAGTTFVAALAASLAKGEPMQLAVAAAKAYVTKALRGAYDLGDGRSLHHFYRYWQPSAAGDLAPGQPEAYR
jgi:hydroxymethylpyrimidine kinase/phosphomethylpyrimidine kinase